MKLTVESTGKRVEISPPEGDRMMTGELFQGETSEGIPCFVMVVMAAPLVTAADPRWDSFDRDREVTIGEDQLHPEIERFPGRVML